MRKRIVFLTMWADTQYTLDLIRVIGKQAAVFDYDLYVITHFINYYNDDRQIIGEENIYYLTAFNSGSFDNYNGQKVLWIEDFRGEFKLQELLRLLDVYKAEVPARFNNAKALWEEVHVTSVLTPQQCYPKACQDDYDRIEQLLRRITSVQYHFKDKYGQFYQLGFPPDTLLNDMLIRVDNFLSFANEFIPLDTLCGNDTDNIAAGGGDLLGHTAAAEGE